MQAHRLHHPARQTHGDDENVAQKSNRFLVADFERAIARL